MREDELRQALQRVAHVLDRLTANWFLDGGSCLGYLRGGRAIDWDPDTDIGIYDPRFDLRKLAERLPVTRYYGVGESVTEAEIYLKTKVDVFRFFDHRGCVAETLHYIGQNIGQNEVKFLLYPKDIFEAGVERATFCGVKCNVLKRSHDYCRTLYGESYLVPDPVYDWWMSPRNGIVMRSEDILVEDVPNILGFWRNFRRDWWSYGPATAARKGLRRIGLRLARELASRFQA